MVRLRQLSLALVWVSLFAVPAGALGGLWTLRLGPVELMDPLAGLSLAASGAASLGVLLAVAPLALLVMLLGRFFCGWICPYRPLLASSRWLRARLAARGVPLGELDLGPRSAFATLGVVLLLTLTLGLPVASYLYPPALIAREAKQLVLYGGLGLGSITVLAFFLYDVFASASGFCRDLCPGGALFRLLGRTSPVQIQRDAAACVPCRACDEVCPLGQRPMTDRLSSGCERCGLCAAACPKDALRLRLGRPLPLVPREPPGGSEA